MAMWRTITHPRETPRWTPRTMNNEFPLVGEFEGIPTVGPPRSAAWRVRSALQPMGSRLVEPRGEHQANTAGVGNARVDVGIDTLESSVSFIE